MCRNFVHNALRSPSPHAIQARAFIRRNTLTLLRPTRADDLKAGLEREIKEIDRQIKEARRATTTALTLEEKLAGQKQIKALEAQRNQMRRSLFDAQDQVDRQREELIAQIEGKLTQMTYAQCLFVIRWALIHRHCGVR